MGEVFKGKLEYLDTSGKCSAYGFVQIAKMSANNGKDFKWLEVTGELARESVKTPNGYYVDHLSSKCKKGERCSPFFIDHWKNPNESSDGNELETADMADYSFGWVYFSSLKLETCALCRDDLRPLACVKWGALWDATKKKEILVPLYSHQPSSDFNQSLELFERYYNLK